PSGKVPGLLYGQAGKGMPPAGASGSGMDGEPDGMIRQAGSVRTLPHKRGQRGPLARVTRGQPRILRTGQTARSAPLAAVAGLLPKLIVRVRFSSPALDVIHRSAKVARAWPVPKAQAVTAAPCH